jgi:Cu/Ag efflux protein CusF
MVSSPKLVGILSCGLLLCLGLSNAAQAEHAPSASDVMKTDSQSDRQGFQSDDGKQTNEKMKKSPTESTKTITGELFRVKDGNYFVKVKGGKEVRLHTDKTTQMIGEVKKGDSIEATMNRQNHALSIRSIQISDTGHGKEQGRDSLGSTN